MDVIWKQGLWFLVFCTSCSMSFVILLMIYLSLSFSAFFVVFRIRFTVSILYMHVCNARFHRFKIEVNLFMSSTHIHTLKCWTLNVAWLKCAVYLTHFTFKNINANSVYLKHSDITMGSATFISRLSTFKKMMTTITLSNDNRKYW